MNLKEFINAQIQELTNQEQLHFANWQRVQGAKAAFRQVLDEIEKTEKQADISLETQKS